MDRFEDSFHHFSLSLSFAPSEMIDEIKEAEKGIVERKRKKEEKEQEEKTRKMVAKLEERKKEWLKKQ